MSQTNVERVVGQLATDEAFRRRFADAPRAILEELVAGGMKLTGCEQEALASLDLDQLTRFADAIDPRIQKSDLTNGTSEGTAT